MAKKVVTHKGNEGVFAASVRQSNENLNEIIMSTITIDSKIYKGAEIYAKLHNISVDSLVEKFLMKFQISSESETASKESDDVLDALDENLMRKTFEAAHQDYLSGHYKAHDQVMSEMRAKYV